MTTSHRRVLGAGIAATALAALVAGTPAVAAERPTPPVAGQGVGPLQAIQLLSFNDYHGHLRGHRPAAEQGARPEPDPGRRRGVPRHRAEPRCARRPPAGSRSPSPRVTSSAARPSSPALFHDEPSVESLNAMGLDVIERRQPRVRRGHHRAAAHAERRLPPGRRAATSPDQPYAGEAIIMPFQYLLKLWLF